METPEFITIKEAAHKLRITLGHLYHCIREKRGPPVVNAAGVLRIPADAFEHWVKNGGDGPVKRGRKRRKKGK